MVLLTMDVGEGGMLPSEHSAMVVNVPVWEDIVRSTAGWSPQVKELGTSSNI